MRAVLLAAMLMLFLPKPVLAQQGLDAAPEIASYTIDVRLDPVSRQLSGRESITYTNTTNQPIPDLVFHLYLNAFKDENSIFMQESGPLHRGFGWDPDHPGWIEVTDIRLVNGPELVLETLEDGTLARAILPRQVGPSESVQVEVSFVAQLPRVFARTGWALDRQGDPFFMVGQWFPKLGVWQESGWNAYAFHANSEFFADFGRYEVSITLPEGYQTGATGVETSSRANGDGTRTVTYRAEGVIDFAWTASPHFQQAIRKVGNVEVVYIYLPEHAWSVARELDAAEKAIQDYTSWFGSYPYPRLTLVDPPDAGQGAGGMEYPSLVTLGTLDFTGLAWAYTRTGWEHTLEMIAVHEIAHQWWQSVVATNEAEEPWLDEGMADYSAARLMEKEWGAGRSLVHAGQFDLGYLDYRRGEYIMMPYTSMAGKAWDFDQIQYGIAAYSKPAASLMTLQNILGASEMDALMQAYYTRWQFGHPTALDFRATAQAVSGQKLTWFFGDPAQHGGLVYGKGTLNYVAQAIDQNSFTIIRQGDLAVPTQIQVVFSDGTRTTLEWDGSQTHKTFQFAQPLRSFEIDPQHKLVVELDWTDNGLSRQADWPAWLSTAARLVYRLQDLLLILGGI